MPRKAKPKELMVTKGALINAVNNTYEDSRFFVGRSTKEDCDFSSGLSSYSSHIVSRAELLTEIRENASPQMRSIPGFPDDLVLNSKTYLYIPGVHENQIFHTDVPEGYKYLPCNENLHHGVYYRIDKESKTISIMLGKKEKTLSIEHDYEFVFKLRGKSLFCGGADDLERFFADGTWMLMVVRAFRKSLGLRTCEFLKAKYLITA